MSFEMTKIVVCWTMRKSISQQGLTIKSSVYWILKEKDDSGGIFI